MSKPVILCVDDEATILESLKIQFKKHLGQDYLIETVDNGPEAIEVCEELQEDHEELPLVICDYYLEGMQGDEILAEIHQRFPKTLKIMLTGKANLEIVESAIKKVRLYRYISKPWETQDLLLTIQEALNSYWQDRQLEMKTEKLVTMNQELEELSTKQAELIEDLQEKERKLIQTQLQLIQTEKMSSLGYLISGIAHEINNPVNFILGNIQHTRDYIQDLVKLGKICESHQSKLPSEVEYFLAEIDFDFIVKDSSKILESMEVGASRINDIVLSLNNFSRLDQSDLKLVDVHEGIESTLNIIQKQLKGKSYNIEIIKQYGNLPQIECYPRQLNQVFMNILRNSIDALKCQKNNEPRITIKTEIIPQEASPNPDILIKICDNGMGMDEETQKHIFDPFFTTKPVGKGTGLGLSISHQIIVKQHGGQICCNSVPQEGTEFIIKIPSCLSQGGCHG
ncbi:ATP-binding protein [Spirulina sp. CS-785/01]|uniref:hybrid sensor histidine kinase/response regulator n=1 Tax=Spirulina sp. CS-785/01 TaxID=3021716 RepID=UPI00232BFDD3|nr:ATP-binding protein [Spirulina sp. CS-785/01]MDB9312616.1 ATP-binding protein [Spirulina sp. CS-785/01]